MSTPPPRRRRISSLVTVRRAQSERRYLSPWQQSSAHATSSRFWQPILYPSPSAGHLSAFPPLVCPKGWPRIDHRLEHHHHAPRTALIPPAPPRSHQAHMIGRSQLVLNGDLWGGSVKHRARVPLMPHAQLPPLALGSPPPLMAVPPMVVPPGNLQEKLAQDRLTAFLSGDSNSTYKPRSILSCPESPLYESLVSTFSTMEDDVNLDHEYQQIPALVNPQGRKPPNSQYSGGNTVTNALPPTRILSDSAQEYQAVSEARITTLDVRPEKNASRDKDPETAAESQICSCQSNKSTDSGKAGSSSPSKQIDNSSQTVCPSSEFHRSTVYLSDEKGGSSSTETISSLSDSDTYQDIDRPPTVIFLPSPAKDSAGRANSFNKNEESSPSGSEVRPSQSFSSQDKRVVSPRSKSNISVASTTNLKSSHSIRSSSHKDPSRTHRMSFSKSPETTYLPLTIELPETKENPRKPDQNAKRHQNSSPGPHIITTLDPPIRNKNFLDWSSEPSDIPPLVVNFDSESEDDLANEADLSSATTMDDNSTSLYMTEGDTTSLYSSIAELYSVIPADIDSLVYVYKAVPNKPFNGVIRHPSSVGYRIPYMARNRSDDCDSSCSSCGGSSDSSSWSETISFVEPTYRPTNLSVGSRGHLKIDYSWSWDHLDNFVRTTSPRSPGSSEDRVGSPRRSVYSNHSSQGRPLEERKASQRAPLPLPPGKPAPGGTTPFGVTNAGVVSPWEKYSDPVAG